MYFELKQRIHISKPTFNAIFYFFVSTFQGPFSLHLFINNQFDINSYDSYMQFILNNN